MTEKQMMELCTNRY